MPGFDRTVPLGQGSGTGLCLGPCRGNTPGAGFGRGRGGAGFYRERVAGRSVGFGTGQAKMMRRDDLIADEDNFSRRGWFRRRNRIWAK